MPKCAPQDPGWSWSMRRLVPRCWWSALAVRAGRRDGARLGRPLRRHLARVPVVAREESMAGRSNGRPMCAYTRADAAAGCLGGLGNRGRGRRPHRGRGSDGPSRRPRRTAGRPGPPSTGSARTPAPTRRSSLRADPVAVGGVRGVLDRERPHGQGAGDMLRDGGGGMSRARARRRRAQFRAARPSRTWRRDAICSMAARIVGPAACARTIRPLRSMVAWATAGRATAGFAATAIVTRADRTGSAATRSSEPTLPAARSANPCGTLPWVSTRTAAVSAALLIAGSLPW